MDTFKRIISYGMCLLVPLISYAENLHLPDVHESAARFHASGSVNAAFLTQFTQAKVSYLEAFGEKGNGDFINFNQSDNAYQVGLKTESYYRMNDRIMLYGMMSYKMNRGKHMAGSAFISPENTPFDLIEMSDSCAGDKRKEAYTLQGGLGYQLNQRISLGGKIFYQAANYAKFKDLRHQNKQMNLRVDAGASYQVVPWMTLGLSYSYNRQNEAIGFGIYGNTDQQFYTLISLGSFFGRSEYFGESGYTSETTPLFTQTHGGAFQAAFQWKDNIHWFNEIHYNHFDGRFGSGASRDITYSNHNGNFIGYNGKLVWDQLRHSHVFTLSFDKNLMENAENKFKESTDDLGVTTIKYYGENQVFERNRKSMEASYTFYKNGLKTRAKYYAGTRFKLNLEDSRTTLYPFYRQQKINTWQADAYGTYNWFKGKQIFSLSLLAGYGSGSGTMKKDGTFTSVSPEQKQPDRRDDLLKKQYDFLTASRIYGKMGMGYERLLLNHISGYIIGSVSPRYALNSSMKDDSYWQFTVQLGVKF